MKNIFAQNLLDISEDSLNEPINLTVQAVPQKSIEVDSKFAETESNKFRADNAKEEDPFELQ